jgi:hypothetical protein
MRARHLTQYPGRNPRFITQKNVGHAPFDATAVRTSRLPERARWNPYDLDEDSKGRFLTEATSALFFVQS